MKKVFHILGQTLLLIAKGLLYLGIGLLCYSLLFVVLPAFWNRKNESKYWDYRKYYQTENVRTKNFINNSIYTFPVSTNDNNRHVLLDFNYTPCRVIYLPFLNIEVKDDSLCIHSLNYSSYNGEETHFNEWFKVNDIVCTEEERYMDVFDPSFHIFPEAKWVKYRVAFNEWKKAYFDIDEYELLEIQKKATEDIYCCSIRTGNLWICLENGINFSKSEWERKNEMKNFLSTGFGLRKENKTNVQ